MDMERKDATDFKKQPLYMKWWIWISIFFVTAFLVNYLENRREINQADILSHQTRDVFLVVDDLDSDSDFTLDDENFDYFLHSSGLNVSHVAFKVGVDIPTGVYLAIAHHANFGYILITSGPSNDINHLLWQKHFENHSIIELNEGEFITAVHTTLIPIDDATIIGFVDGILRAGTYKVGRDIPPGVYTLFPHDYQTGFFETTTSSHSKSNSVLQSRNFDEAITIALNYGDYLSFKRAEIRK